MSGTIRLSFCIPVYNFGAFITQTLDSIAPSLDSHADMEAVVLDGGSTDDTPAIMAAYCARHPRVRYVRQDQRGGIDADMARSVALACGEYCWLLSGDDLVRPGAIDELRVLLDEGHDVYLSEHTQCDIAMRHLGDHPVFRRRDGFSANLGDPVERLAYLADARNSEALFSFMSGLIVRRHKWLSAPEPVDFMRSCWGHVARLLASTDPDLRVRVVGRQWIDRRGATDSFRAHGTVRRLAIAVDGYQQIATRFYGAASAEAAEIRRLIRADLGVRLFLQVRVMCAHDPAREDRAQLDRLVRALYADPRLDCLIARLLYFLKVPDALIEQAAIVVRFLRRIVHRLRGRPESTAAAGAARTDRTP